MASPQDPESDEDFGYDLSLEDEQLLAIIADGASNNSASEAVQTVAYDIPSNHLRSSPKGKTSLRAVGRTFSINAFVQGIQPQSAPSIVPADNAQYPDRKYSDRSASACLIQS